MSWDLEMLAALEAPEQWSFKRRQAEAEWAKIWRGRTGFAVIARHVVQVERRKRRPMVEMKAAA